MAVPKHRTSKQKKRSRRSHLALSKPGLNICSNCGQSKLNHTVCKHCGFYKNKEIIVKKAKKTEKDKKETK